MDITESVLTELRGLELEFVSYENAEDYLLNNFEEYVEIAALQTVNSQIFHFRIRGYERIFSLCIKYDVHGNQEFIAFAWPIEKKVLDLAQESSYIQSLKVNED